MSTSPMPAPKPSVKSVLKVSVTDGDDRISKLRIMVAEPSAQLREIVRDILRRGIGVGEVIEVKNGEEAVPMLRDFPCDMIIADAAMSPVGGIELTRYIRKGADRIDPFVPVIIVSGFPEIAEIIDARDAGANEYLAKPLSAKIVELRLNAVLNRPRPFIRSDKFFGPDRRRHAVDDDTLEERRTQEPEVVKPE